MKIQLRFAAVALAAVLAACSHEDEDSAAEACEHMADGPAKAVTATTDAASGPAVNESHTRYDVTLVEVTGGKGGTVSYAAAEETDYAVYLDKDVPLAVTDAAGAAVAIEESVAVTACAEVALKKVVPLKVGTYRFTFGPTAETQVKVVVEEAAGHEAH